MAQEMENTKIIVATGAESTGKTEMCRFIATRLNIPWVPELSRKFVEQLGRPYTYNDVVELAHMQFDEFKTTANAGHKVVLFDTDLIITKVWLEVVYKKCPNWITDAIKELPATMHLFCQTDIPWVADSVRENGGEMREKLSEIYKAELQHFNLPYTIISGKGDERWERAEKAVKTVMGTSL